MNLKSRRIFHKDSSQMSSFLKHKQYKRFLNDVTFKQTNHEIDDHILSKSCRSTHLQLMICLLKTSQNPAFWKKTKKSLEYLTPGTSNLFYDNRFTYIQLIVFSNENENIFALHLDSLESLSNRHISTSSVCTLLFWWQFH